MVDKLRIHYLRIPCFLLLLFIFVVVDVGADLNDGLWDVYTFENDTIQYPSYGYNNCGGTGNGLCSGVDRRNAISGEIYRLGFWWGQLYPEDCVCNSCLYNSEDLSQAAFGGSNNFVWFTTDEWTMSLWYMLTKQNDSKDGYLLEREDEWLLSKNVVGDLTLHHGQSGYVLNWSVDLNTWYHLVLVMNGTHQKLYVNSTLLVVYNETEANVESARISMSNFFNYPVFVRWDGKVDELYFWNRSLSYDEILELDNKYFVRDDFNSDCVLDEIPIYGDYEDYWDLWDFYAFELTGTVWLALIVGLFIIFYFCSKINLPFQMTLLIATLWLSVVAAITLHMFIWALVVLEVGTLYYWVISSKLRRG